MADFLFDKARQAFGNGVVNLSTDTIKVALVTSAYTPDQANHQFYSDLTPGSNVLGTPVALTFTSDTAGVYKATIPSFSSVPSGTVTYLAMYKDTGTASTSPLLLLLDGKRTLTVAAAPTGSPYTSIPVDPLPVAIPTGKSITFSGASGAVTTSGTSAVGARALTVASTAVTGIAAGATGTADYGMGVPVTSNGVNFSITVTPDATNGWFKI